MHDNIVTQSNTAGAEVQGTSSEFLGMSPVRFLRDYWQKKPLLIRNALQNFISPITPNDLAGLACEEMALSRLVMHTPKNNSWRLRNGPFGESDFSSLPKSHWTLLVQDVDKWDIHVAALLDLFRFIPDWRIDDVMASYAVDGGSVGAHVDQYDVFLLQGTGQRRWQINTDANAPKQFRSDTELKLLTQFTPTDEWLLLPGDILYLPPGVPHYGIAEGECMTFSIGLRAPSHAELFSDFAEFVAERLPEDQRYGDADLRAARFPGEIDTQALQRVRHTLATLGNVDGQQLRTWFGPFITRYRNAHLPAPRPRALSDTALRKRLQQGYVLRRNPWTRIAYTTVSAGAELYASGDTYACSLALARLLSTTREIEASALLQLSPDELDKVRHLLNAGHFITA